MRGLTGKFSYPFILSGSLFRYLAMLSHNISRGHYLPYNTYCLALAFIKVTIHIRPLRFFHDLAKI